MGKLLLVLSLALLPGLASAGQQESLLDLLKALDNDDPKLVLVSASKLHRRGCSIEDLNATKGLLNSSDPLLRRSAFYYFWRCYLVPNRTSYQPQLLVPTIRSLLKDPDPVIRREAENIVAEERYYLSREYVSMVRRSLKRRCFHHLGVIKLWNSDVESSELVQLKSELAKLRKKIYSSRNKTYVLLSKELVPGDRARIAISRKSLPDSLLKDLSVLSKEPRILKNLVWIWQADKVHNFRIVKVEDADHMMLNFELKKLSSTSAVRRDMMWSSGLLSWSRFKTKQTWKELPVTKRDRLFAVQEAYGLFRYTVKKNLVSGDGDYVDSSSSKPEDSWNVRVASQAITSNLGLSKYKTKKGTYLYLVAPNYFETAVIGDPAHLVVYRLIRNKWKELNRYNVRSPSVSLDIDGDGLPEINELVGYEDVAVSKVVPCLERIGLTDSPL